MNARNLFAVALLVFVVAALLNSLSLGQIKTIGEVPPPTNVPAAAEGEVGRYTVAAWSEGSSQTGWIVVCDTRTGQCWSKPTMRDPSVWTDRGSPVKKK